MATAHYLVLAWMPYKRTTRRDVETKTLQFVRVLDDGKRWACLNGRIRALWGSAWSRNLGAYGRYRWDRVKGA